MPDPDAPSTANLCDAALALGCDVLLTTDLRPLDPAWRLEGAARCARHFGSVDVFLEAIDQAVAGEVLVIDNAGRDDEGCIGDLIVLEAAKAGLAGIVVWGRHRDSADLRRIGCPVFSRGSCAAGPNRLDPRSANPFDDVRLGSGRISNGDWVVADEDGVLVIPSAQYQPVRVRALEIRKTESAQAERMNNGSSLREQLEFDEFKAARERDPSLTFRNHLSARGGAIEV
jgi:4-hydroxy-4-methyl-2-oxoglutarate aldolase